MEVSGEIPLEVPQNLHLPNYLPTTTETLREINSLLSSRDEVVNRIDEQIKSIKSAVDKFIEFVVVENLFRDMSDIKQTLEKHRHTVHDLLKVKSEAEMWKGAYQASRSRVLQNMHGEENLSLQNLEHYQQSEEPTFAQMVSKEYDNSTALEAHRNDFDNYIKANEPYQFIKNVCFIIDHPEDPLPDEVEDEEISVAGGKISLKDPISLNYFQEPMKSRRCNHVYEREHILQALLSEYSGNQCPVSGCSSRMNVQDLIPDELMTIRVKVYQANYANNSNGNSDIRRL